MGTNLRPPNPQNQMRRYGSEFYQKLADEFKTEHGYVQNGGLAIATNAER